MYILRKLKIKTAVHLSLLTGLLFSFSLAHSQQVKLLYNVKKGDKIIGSMALQETINGVNKTLSLESHIKTSFVMDIEVDAKEESVFKNNVLINSSVYRKVNGSVKVNKKLRAHGTGYIIESARDTDTLHSLKIMYNLMNMYTIEPVSITKVYSDTYQKFIPILKTAPHVYRVDIPGGSYNKYFYKDGRCIKVEMHQTLYTVTMELT